MVAVVELYCPVAACVAFSVTVPTPVSVTTFPAIVAGPLTTEYVTAPLELDVAETANGDAPKTWLPISEKLSEGVPLADTVTVVLAEVLPNALRAVTV